jgi:hypothetical protein
MKNFLPIIAVLVISIPTFQRMLRPGIYSMQDFHLFRLIEFEKCVRDFQIPCRWSPDAGLGYGEPLFNFYGQLSYAIGETFRLIGFSLINSLKLLFILSLVGSGLSMFILSKYIWKNNLSATLSACLYMYAPYRAVDIWVRGTIPESLSFILFPLIIYKIETFLAKNNKRDLFWISIIFSLLILNHNLSVILFLPFLLIWVPFRLIYYKKAKLTFKILISLGASILISSFYILPLLLESKYINLESTSLGFFDFRAHFASVYQLLISRYWGYGASVFKNGLSVSVGLIHWLLPLLIAISLLIRRKTKTLITVLVLLMIGWFCIFMTHNRSTPIWLMFNNLKYIQFPWRFLSIAVFSFSLASGAMMKIFENIRINYIFYTFALILAVLLNYNFFREDIWYQYNDNDFLEGSAWEEQTRASIWDYWPKFGMIPANSAPPQFSNQELVYKGSRSAIYNVGNKGGLVSFPIAYFPGWSAKVNNIKTDIFPDKDGLITMDLNRGNYTVKLFFTNTPVRSLGNAISLLSILILLFIYFKELKYEK